MAVANPAAVPGADAVPTDSIVLYDGNCGLCAKSVRFILDHERDHDLRFAPLQGETAAALRARHPNIPQDIDTVVFVDGGKAHLRSKAILHLANHLKSPWRWMRAFRWMPGALLDLGYRLVAKVRYKLFGTVDACELPSPAQRARFLP